LSERQPFKDKRVAMVYMKIVTENAVRHLCVLDQFSNDAKTLCGRTVTQSQSWKQIRSLEGDECGHCAQLAFGGESHRSKAAGSH
jgi:hypothetical protein